MLSLSASLQQEHSVVWRVSCVCPQEHVSHPSIAMYTVFNEGWGQYDTQRVVQWAKSLDPSRLWDAASGWEDPQDRISYKDPGNKAYHHYVGYVRLSHHLT